MSFDPIRPPGPDLPKRTTPVNPSVTSADTKETAQQKIELDIASMLLDGYNPSALAYVPRDKYKAVVLNKQDYKEMYPDRFQSQEQLDQFHQVMNDVATAFQMTPARGKRPPYMNTASIISMNSDLIMARGGDYSYAYNPKKIATLESSFLGDKPIMSKEDRALLTTGGMYEAIDGSLQNWYSRGRFGRILDGTYVLDKDSNGNDFIKQIHNGIDTSGKDVLSLWGPQHLYSQSVLAPLWGLISNATVGTAQAITSTGVALGKGMGHLGILSKEERENMALVEATNGREGDMDMYLASVGKGGAQQLNNFLTKMMYKPSENVASQKFLGQHGAWAYNLGAGIGYLLPQRGAVMGVVKGMSKVIVKAMLKREAAIMASKGTARMTADEINKVVRMGTKSGIFNRMYGSIRVQDMLSSQGQLTGSTIGTAQAISGVWQAGKANNIDEDDLTLIVAAATPAVFLTERLIGSKFLLEGLGLAEGKVVARQLANQGVPEAVLKAAAGLKNKGSAVAAQRIANNLTKLIRGIRKGTGKIADYLNADLTKNASKAAAAAGKIAQATGKAKLVAQSVARGTFREGTQESMEELYYMIEESIYDAVHKYSDPEERRPGDGLYGTNIFSTDAIDRLGENFMAGAILGGLFDGVFINSQRNGDIDRHIIENELRGREYIKDMQKDWKEDSTGLSALDIDGEPFDVPPKPYPGQEGKVPEPDVDANGNKLSPEEVEAKKVAEQPLVINQNGELDEFGFERNQEIKNLNDLRYFGFTQKVLMWRAILKDVNSDNPEIIKVFQREDSVVGDLFKIASDLRDAKIKASEADNALKKIKENTEAKPEDVAKATSALEEANKHVEDVRAQYDYWIKPVEGTKNYSQGVIDNVRMDSMARRLQTRDKKGNIRYDGMLHMLMVNKDRTKAVEELKVMQEEYDGLPDGAEKVRLAQEMQDKLKTVEKLTDGVFTTYMNLMNNQRTRRADNEEVVRIGKDQKMGVIAMVDQLFQDMNDGKFGDVTKGFPDVLSLMEEYPELRLSKLSNKTKDSISRMFDIFNDVEMNKQTVPKDDKFTQAVYDQFKHLDEIRMMVVEGKNLINVRQTGEVADTSNLIDLKTDELIAQHKLEASIANNQDLDVKDRKKAKNNAIKIQELVNDLQKLKMLVKHEVKFDALHAPDLTEVQAARQTFGITRAMEVISGVKNALEAQEKPSDMEIEQLVNLLDELNNAWLYLEINRNLKQVAKEKGNVFANMDFTERDNSGTVLNYGMDIPDSIIDQLQADIQQIEDGFVYNQKEWLDRFGRKFPNFNEGQSVEGLMALIQRTNAINYTREREDNIRRRKRLSHDAAILSHILNAVAADTDILPVQFHEELADLVKLMRTPSGEMTIHDPEKVSDDVLLQLEVSFNDIQSRVHEHLMKDDNGKKFIDYVARASVPIEEGSELKAPLVVKILRDSLKGSDGLFFDKIWENHSSSFVYSYDKEYDGHNPDVYVGQDLFNLSDFLVTKLKGDGLMFKETISYFTRVYYNMVNELVASDPNYLEKVIDSSIRNAGLVETAHIDMDDHILSVSQRNASRQVLSSLISPHRFVASRGRTTLNAMKDKNKNFQLYESDDIWTEQYTSEKFMDWDDFIDPASGNKVPMMRDGWLRGMALNGAAGSGKTTVMTRTLLKALNFHYSQTGKVLDVLMVSQDSEVGDTLARMATGLENIRVTKMTSTEFSQYVNSVNSNTADAKYGVVFYDEYQRIDKAMAGSIHSAFNNTDTGFVFMGDPKQVGSEIITNLDQSMMAISTIVPRSDTVREQFRSGNAEAIAFMDHVYDKIVPALGGSAQARIRIPLTHYTKDHSKGVHFVQSKEEVGNIFLRDTDVKDGVERVLIFPTKSDMELWIRQHASQLAGRSTSNIRYLQGSQGKTDLPSATGKEFSVVYVYSDKPQDLSIHQKKVYYTLLSRHKSGLVLVGDSTSNIQSVETDESGIPITVMTQEGLEPYRKKMLERSAILATGQARDEAGARNVTSDIMSRVLQSQKDNEIVLPDNNDENSKYVINGVPHMRTGQVIPKQYRSPGSKSQRRIDGGNTVDSITRAFFKNAHSKPDGITQQAYDKLINSLTVLKTAMEKAGWHVIPDNIVLWDSTQKIAGTTDLIFYNDKGEIMIMDIKTMSDMSDLGNKSSARYKTFQAQLNTYRILFINQHQSDVKYLSVLPFKVDVEADGTVKDIVPGSRVGIDIYKSQKEHPWINLNPLIKPDKTKLPDAPKTPPPIQLFGKLADIPQESIVKVRGETMMKLTSKIPFAFNEPTFNKDGSKRLNDNLRIIKVKAGDTFVNLSKNQKVKVIGGIKLKTVSGDVVTALVLKYANGEEMYLMPKARIEENTELLAWSDIAGKPPAQVQSQQMTIDYDGVEEDASQVEMHSEYTPAYNNGTEHNDFDAATNRFPISLATINEDLTHLKGEQYWIKHAENTSAKVRNLIKQGKNALLVYHPRYETFVNGKKTVFTNGVLSVGYMDGSGNYVAIGVLHYPYLNEQEYSIRNNAKPIDTNAKPKFSDPKRNEFVSALLKLHAVGRSNASGDSPIVIGQVETNSMVFNPQVWVDHPNARPLTEVISNVTSKEVKFIKGDASNKFGFNDPTKVYQVIEVNPNSELVGNTSIFPYRKNVPVLVNTDLLMNRKDIYNSLVSEIEELKEAIGGLAVNAERLSKANQSLNDSKVMSHIRLNRNIFTEEVNGQRVVKKEYSEKLKYVGKMLVINDTDSNSNAADAMMFNNAMELVNIVNDKLGYVSISRMINGKSVIEEEFLSAAKTPFNHLMVPKTSGKITMNTSSAIKPITPVNPTNIQSQQTKNNCKGGGTGRT